MKEDTTDGETTEGGEVSVVLNAHGLGGDEGNDGRVTVLDVLGSLLCGSTSTTIDLGVDLSELAGLHNFINIILDKKIVSIYELRGGGLDIQCGQCGNPTLAHIRRGSVRGGS